MSKTGIAGGDGFVGGIFCWAAIDTHNATAANNRLNNLHLVRFQFLHEYPPQQPS